MTDVSDNLFALVAEKLRVLTPENKAHVVRDLHAWLNRDADVAPDFFWLTYDLPWRDILDIQDSGVSSDAMLIAFDNLLIRFGITNDVVNLKRETMPYRLQANRNYKPRNPENLNWVYLVRVFQDDGVWQVEYIDNGGYGISHIMPAKTFYTLYRRLLDRNE